MVELGMGVVGMGEEVIGKEGMKEVDMENEDTGEVMEVEDIVAEAMGVDMDIRDLISC